jgi:hypothetical protein
MKKALIVMMAVLLTLACFSCKGKDSKLPQGEVKPSMYAPLPSFKEVFRTLDQLKVSDVSASLPVEVYKTPQEEAHNAFALGVLTADAVLAAKGRNKAKLMDISAQMMALTPLLKLEDEINQLGARTKILIEQNNWEELDANLDQIKKTVEDKLWEMENYENYTLMIFGGWTEAANRVAWMISQNYDPKQTEILAQEGQWNLLVQNLDLVSSEFIKNSPAFQKSVPIAKEVQTLLKANTDKTYGKEQLEQLIAKTQAIREAYQR